MGNQFLANIREVDAIIHVVRCFDNDNIVHVEGVVNPISDKEVIDTELQLRDLDSVEKRFVKIEKLVRSGDQMARKEYEVLSAFKKHLESGQNARSLDRDDDAMIFLDPLNLLTDKPVIYVANVEEDYVINGNHWSQQLVEFVDKENTEVILICASLEAQIAEFEDEVDKNLFLAEYGLTESGLNRLIKISYRILRLITYFTAGAKEVRAWTIKEGWKAPQAAGVIHTDFEKGFIKAEVIKLLDYERYQTEQACKEAGKLAIEGKST